MKKMYEAPRISEIKFEVEDRLMASVTHFDNWVDAEPVDLPKIDIFA